MWASGRLDNDEQWIQICRLSFGRHITVSDVAPGMCVSKEKGWDDLLCTVTTLGVVSIGWSHVVGVIGQASWMIVVVEKEHCGLLMVPKSSISVCRCSILNVDTIFDNTIGGFSTEFHVDFFHGIHME